MGGGKHWRQMGRKNGLESVDGRKHGKGNQMGVVGDCQMGESMRGGRGKRDRTVLNGSKDGRVLEWRRNGRVQYILYTGMEKGSESARLDKRWESTGVEKGWESTVIEKRG